MGRFRGFHFSYVTKWWIKILSNYPHSLISVWTFSHFSTSISHLLFETCYFYSILLVYICTLSFSPNFFTVIASSLNQASVRPARISVQSVPVKTDCQAIHRRVTCKYHSVIISDFFLICCLLEILLLTLAPVYAAKVPKPSRIWLY